MLRFAGNAAQSYAGVRHDYARKPHILPAGGAAARRGAGRVAGEDRGPEPRRNGTSEVPSTRPYATTSSPELQASHASPPNALMAPARMKGAVKPPV
jgi:hypothetical protein